MIGDVTLDVQTSLTAEEIEECLAVIGEGGAVNQNLAIVRKRLPQAVLLTLTRDGQNIVAVGVIKQKRPNYAASITKKCGFKFDTSVHELGYIAVKETHRQMKLSYRMAATLLARFPIRPHFATTSNPYMKRTLMKLGFIQRGKEWEGSDGNPLSLWLKDADVPN